MKPRWRNHPFRIALQTSVLYGALGALWILLSDHLLRALVKDAALLQQWEIYKGWGFIALTAVILYFVLRAQLSRLASETNARRLAMEALGVSEERFQLAMRGTNDGVWDWNLEDNTIYFSPRYKLMLGYQPEELRDSLETWRNLTHPEDRERALEDMKTFSSSHSEFFESEFRMRHKEGHWVDILSRGFAIRRAGRIVRLVGTHVDLTARKQAEEKLRQQEELYRTVLNSVRDVVFQGSIDGNWTFLNSAWENITGYSVDESLGHSFLEFVHPEDREENWKRFEPMMRREIAYCQHAVRYLHKRGGFRWMEVHAQLIGEGGATTLIIAGTLRDVTERRLSEEALRKNEEHLRQAAAVAGVGTFEHNHLTDDIYMSPFLRKLHGFPDSATLTMAAFMDRIYPDDRPAAIAAIHQAHSPAGDGRFAFDVRVVTPSGEIRWVRSRSQTFFDGEGAERRLVRTIGAAVDITELKQAETAIRDRENQYRAVIETSADGFLMLDMNSRILEANDAYIRRSGYSREQLLSMRIDDLESGSKAESLVSRLDEIRRQGAVLFETLHRTQDGTLWEAEVDVSHWSIAGGRLFAFIRDVNGRKRSESLLRTRVDLSRLAETSSSEELLQHALDRIELLTGSKIGCIHFVNAAAKMITLQACSSAVRHVIGQQFSREQLPVNESAVLNRALETGAPVIENDCDTEHLRIDQITAPVRLLRRVAVPVFQQGQITAVVCVANKATDYNAEDVSTVQEISGIVMDLFERKRAEQALQESEHRLQLAVNAAGIGYWEVALQSGRIKYSDSFANVMGVPPEELPETLEAFVKKIHADDRPVVQERVSRSIATGEPYNTEFRFQWPDGRIQWFAVLGRVSHDKDEKADRFTGIAMDVTSRKVAEERLRSSEERHRALVETTFDWIWELDRELKFTFSSAKSFDLLGYHPDELTGRHYSELLGTAAESPQSLCIPDDHVPFADKEAECRHRDGHLVVIQASGVPVFGPDGEFLGYRGSSRNITDRKLAEKHREALEGQLRQAQKMEAIGTLAGGVAHDFNNILTVIHGNASLLLNPEMRGPDRSDCAQQIVRAAERAAGLTRQLLMFSRKQVMQVSNVNLNNVVANLTKMLQRIVGEDITLQTIYAPSLALVRADIGMIEQILLNLVVNARDAMPHGGQLTIATGSQTFAPDQIDEWAEAAAGPHIWLRVSDTGCGIAPEVLPRIFEPFFTTKEVGKGTGLGLATVYGIVRQHRGWITVQSEPRRGSTFTIYLPAITSGTVLETASTDPLELPRGSETLLVVEDDAAVRNLMINVLERCGYRVLPSSSGRAALDLWEENGASIQLLLTDLVMPDGVTGLQLAEAVRKQRPNLPVIYVTGYSAELAAKGTALIEGVNFLQKPFSPNKLAHAVRRLLNDSRSGKTGSVNPGGPAQ